ncbi:MAG: hypothetical protein EOP88_03890 [Verrucomicrobiaceae bacterium]|nr:MAG: hypothetical protein EOP88_03890 [Verrucomicrobiaceae bacterium]
MKTSHALGLVAASVIITVAIEESRMSSLRQITKTESTGSAIASKAPGATATTPAADTDAPTKTKSRSELAPASPAKPVEAPDESFANTARKMLDNPAGKSMLNQQAKMMVNMTYQDLIDGMNLSKEEGDYFKDLLGKEITDQQELGLKMLSATPEERKGLSEELTKRAAATQEEIKKFLNNEEDYKKFTDYKERLPEKQQMAGIQATMSGAGVSMDADTEAKLLDAMYRARTDSKAPDFSGPGAMEEFAKGNITETFEKSWQAQQDTLSAEAGKFLSEPQMKAFQDYQKQMKEMQLMGLKMAEKMMPKDK